MSQEPTYVGIDVSKEWMDVGVRPTGRSWSVSYDRAGVDDLVARLKDLEPSGVITESTGGLELPLVAALAAASVPVAVVNPRQVRDFAKSTGQLAKTDRLDGRSGSGALRGSSAVTDSALTGQRHTGARGRAGAQVAGDEHPCGGEEPPESCRSGSTP